LAISISRLCGTPRGIWPIFASLRLPPPADVPLQWKTLLAALASCHPHRPPKREVCERNSLRHSSGNSRNTSNLVWQTQKGSFSCPELAPRNQDNKLSRRLESTRRKSSRSKTEKNWCWKLSETLWTCSNCDNRNGITRMSTLTRHKIYSFGIHKPIIEHSLTNYYRDTQYHGNLATFNDIYQ
jgi:hypothetical protein